MIPACIFSSTLSAITRRQSVPYVLNYALIGTPFYGTLSYPSNALHSIILPLGAAANAPGNGVPGQGNAGSAGCTSNNYVGGGGGTYPSLCKVIQPPCPKYSNQSFLGKMQVRAAMSLADLRRINSQRWSLIFQMRGRH